MPGFSDTKRLLTALAACALAIVLGGAVGDGLVGLIVVAAMVPAVKSVHGMRASSAWRQIIAGGVLIGFAPLASFPLAGPWTWGDLLAFAGYAAFIAGLERAIRVRTQKLQVDVLLDAVLIAGWIICIMNIFVVDELAAKLSGIDLVGALSYMPFTMILLVQLLRLGFGSPEHSRSFRFLSAATAAAVSAEFLFLLDAVGGAGLLRPWAVSVAGAGLVLISAAVSDPSAGGLERPKRGDFRRVDGLRGTLHVTSIVLLVVIALTASHRSEMVSATVLVLGALISVRMYVVVKERERWIQSERKMQSVAASLLDAEDQDSVLELCSHSVEDLVGNRTTVVVEVVQEHDDGWFVLDRQNGRGDEVDSGDLIGAVAAGSTRYFEFSSGQGSRYVSRLVVPILTSGSGRLAVVVEAMPVLDPLQVTQIEVVAATVRLSLEALSARERTHQQRAHHRFRALSQDSNDIVGLVRNDSSVVDVVGPTLERLLGRSDDEFLGSDPLLFVHNADAERIRSLIGSVAQGALVAVEPFDVRLSHSNGRHHWFTASVRDLRDDPEVGGLVYSFRDVNDRKMAEIQVRTSEGRYRALVQNSNDVFAVVDQNEFITYVSPNVTRLLGFSPGDLIGTHVRGLLTPRGAATLARTLEESNIEYKGEEMILELRTNTADVRIARVAFTEMLLDDEVSLLITAHDITEQLLLEENLRRQALYDTLTGVLNRSSVIPELQRALQSLQSDETIAVFHLDIVNFSEINSSVGFDEGDSVLIEIADRLRSVIRAEDALARLDGDEFVVVSTCSGPSGSWTVLARKLLSVFDEVFEIGGRRVALRGSLGVSETTDRRQNPTVLLENAGLASRHGRAHDEHLTVFEEEMRAAATERFELAADLKSNLDTDQFTIVYQPLFDLWANQVTSVEALLRWHHPTRGHISPGMFIPLAESTGSIVELGRMVMRRACRQLAEWQGSLPGGEHLAVAVNVSAKQLELPGEAEVLRSIIAEAGVEPSKLTIELTESTFIEDAVWLREQLEGFQRLGIRIAVDDFGAGSAGLSHLRDVPFDILKIDKAYIDDLETSAESVSLVRGVVELAHGLHARLVAEGIETPGQLSILRDMGCDFGQGFFLGRPMTAEALERWIGQGWAGEAAAVIMDETRERASRF